MRPLEGLTVVSLEHAVAGPFCTRQLADYGARVIKVERPDGDLARGYDRSVNGLASYFVWLNRGKESVTLDVKSRAGREALGRIVDRADVLVQNLAPGAAARLGLDHATLAARNPRIIVTDISGYGDDGPYRDKKAYDLLVQAEVGLLSVTGTGDQPARCGVSVADVASAMYAHSAILTALLVRERTGRGTRIEVSMLEALAEWMTHPFYYGHYGRNPPVRAGASHPSIAPYGPHRAGDGRDVLFGIQNEREWATFCREVLGRPELAADPRYSPNSERVANRAELTRLIEQAFATLSAAEVVERLDRAGIANGRLNDIEAAVAHPQLAARGRWRTVGTSAGPVEALLPPANIDGVEPAMGDVPALGQHTDAVLRWVGYGPDEIAAMRAERAI